MGANVKVQVKMPDGTPAAGARILGINHDAWSKEHKEWPGTAGPDGTFAWSNIDTGALGDRYTFRANATDGKGGRYLGEISERIRKDMELTITLAKDGGAEGAAVGDEDGAPAAPDEPKA
jgi:hypothetical protein